MIERQHLVSLQDAPASHRAVAVLRVMSLVNDLQLNKDLVNDRTQLKVRIFDTVEELYGDWQL